MRTHRAHAHLEHTTTQRLDGEPAAKRQAHFSLALGGVEWADEPSRGRCSITMKPAVAERSEAAVGYRECWAATGVAAIARANMVQPPRRLLRSEATISTGKLDRVRRFGKVAIVGVATRCTRTATIARKAGTHYRSKLAATLARILDSSRPSDRIAVFYRTYLEDRHRRAEYRLPLTLAV